MKNNSLLFYSSLFAGLCMPDDEDLIKVAIIREQKGKWKVFSESGKLLGTYKTKKEANSRLKQIHYFKYLKNKKASEEITYSSLLRTLNKKYPREIVKKFKEIYKSHFDQALIEKDPKPEDIALSALLEFINELDNKLTKAASVSEMGDPIFAGKYISEIIKFITRRISPERRSKSLENLKKKIYLLNEYELAGKKMPASSSLGQAITLTKTLLMTKSPQYIRAVLNSIVRFL